MDPCPGPAQIRVLLVEDNPDDAWLVEEALQGGTHSLGRIVAYSVEHAETWQDAAERLDERFDVLLLDLGLPDLSGSELVLEAMERANDMPIIIMTGRDDDDAAKAALDLGVQDYLVKGDINRASLRRTVRHAIQRHDMARNLERARVEQLEMKDEFLSHVSHELRTPLTAIYQFVTILLDGIAGDLNDEQREYVSIVHRNAVQLRDMIADLMEVSRVQMGKLTVEPRPICLEDVLREAADSFSAAAEETGIELESTEPAVLPEIYADPKRVLQVLTNLISNAMKFTPAGGKVGLSARTWSEDSAYVHVSVTDTGCGLPPDALERVFNRLRQEQNGNETSRKGLGLGLYISHQLVTRQSGRIWVESREGEGSRFQFTLPVFSLEGLLAPVVEKSEDDAFALVRIDVRPSEAGAPQIAERALSRIRNRLGDTVYTHLDRLLPRMMPADGAEVFWICARADESAAAAMVQRLRAAMGAWNELRDCAVTIDFELIEVDSKEAQVRLKGATERVRQFIQAQDAGKGEQS